MFHRLAKKSNGPARLSLRRACPAGVLPGAAALAARGKAQAFAGAAHQRPKERGRIGPAKSGHHATALKRHSTPTRGPSGGIAARPALVEAGPGEGGNLTKANELLLNVKERDEHEKGQTSDRLGPATRRGGAPLIAGWALRVLECQFGKYGQHRRVGSAIDNGFCAGELTGAVAGLRTARSRAFAQRNT